MIGSFKDKDAADIFDGVPCRRYSGLVSVIDRKLRALEAAVALQELNVPPGNRLEALKGNRAGQHSIRINEQSRLCFIWRDGNAYEVEIVDYH